MRLFKVQQQQQQQQQQRHYLHNIDKGLCSPQLAELF